MAHLRNTIWKFPLALTTSQEISIPADFKILTVQEQAGQLCLWAEVMPTVAARKLTIYITGTGRYIPDDPHAEYIGSVQQNNFVWHVYRGE